MVRPLYTIGYEGKQIDSFVKLLKNSSIECLVDVREIPLSRKPGFSKTALSQRLDKENIKYIHLKELGSPKELRNKLKTDHNFKVFFEKMGLYLNQKHEAIRFVSSHTKNHSCCLMCFESEATQCHRNVVATKIIEEADNTLRIANL